jgi:hypothetical protein
LIAGLFVETDVSGKAQKQMKQYFVILCIVFLIQLPNWYFLLGRESGGIDDFENENWIAISDLMNLIFSFPIYFFVKDQIRNYELALIIYFLDLALIAAIIYFLILSIKRLLFKYSA